MNDTAAVDFDSLINRIAKVVRTHAPGAARAVLFGSLARREASESCDIDLILVWPVDADEDTSWDVSMETARRLDRITNRICLPLVYDEEDYLQMPNKYPELAASVARDGIDLLTHSILD